VTRLARLTLVVLTVPALVACAPTDSGGGATSSGGGSGGSVPGVSTCGVVMQASYGGQVVSLSDCAALVGLRPIPRIDLKPGETLELLAPISNDRPPVPTSTRPGVLRLVATGTGSRLAGFRAEAPGSARLVIEDPPAALCLEQATATCVVATVVVRPG
jgi:hypothetical protein